MKTVSIFSTVEPYELMKIMDAVKPMEFKKGDTLIKEVGDILLFNRATKETFSSSLSQVKLTQLKTLEKAKSQRK